MEVHEAKTLFGRRKGKKLRAFHAQLMEDRLPKLAVDLAAEVIDPRQIFSFAPAGVMLEIGFGGGEHLASLAASSPQIGFLGCEPFLNGVAKLLASIEQGQLVNIRVLMDDARSLIGKLPDASLDRVYLLYPDPWPKTRQKKRRFVSNESVLELARVLKPGGELRFATDIDDYTAWTFKTILSIEAFEWLNPRFAEWKAPWDGWTQTRYEEKAIREGRSPVYLRFRKI